MKTYRIEAGRTGRGNVFVDWPDDDGHDQLVSALADELEDEMVSDKSLETVYLTIEVVDVLPGRCGATNPETDRACVLPGRHDGMHQTEVGTWFGESS